MIRCLSFLLLMSPLVAFAHVPVRLEVQIENLKTDDGQILGLLFANEDGFPDNATKAKQSKIVDLRREGSRISFDGLEPGKYAVAIIHDLNRNEKLDTGLFGIPKEGIGFSNNPKLGFGAPSFNKVAIDVRTSSTATITLKHY